MKHLEISHVHMEFDTPSGPFVALEDVDLTIEKSEFVSLIGHSGCGIPESFIITLVDSL